MYTNYNEFEKVNKLIIDNETILKILNSYPPLTVLMSLAFLRGHKIILKGIIKKQLGDYSKSLYLPINPILFATAISISTVRNQDYLSLIHRYIEGDNLPNLEEKLIRLDDFHDNVELDSILGVEESYIEGFIKFGEKIRNSNRMARGNEKEEKKICSNLYPKVNIYQYATVWDNFEGAWIAANPVISKIVTNWDSIVRGYGRKINNEIHNARNYYEYHLNETNKSINELLSAHIPSEEKRNQLENLTREQANRVKLQKRAESLYYWNPEEIVAFRAGIIEFLSGVVNQNLPPTGFELAEQFTGMSPPVGFLKDVTRAFQDKPNSLKIWFPWLMSSVISLGISLIILSRIEKSIFSVIPSDIAASAFSGLIAGITVGFAHWIIMRRHLENTRYWIGGTSIVFAICFALIHFVYTNATILFDIRLSLIMISALLLVMIGALQKIALRERARKMIELWEKAEFGIGKLYELDDFEKYGLEILERLTKKYGD